MKPFRLIYIFIIALIFLLGLQFAWLYNTYQLEKEKTQQTINETFINAAKQELSDRLDMLESIYKSQGVDSLSFSGYTMPMDSGFLNKTFSAEFIALQYFLDKELSLPLNIHALDSIYTSFLQEENIQVNYNIVYLDSLGQTIKETSPGISNGYKTEEVPIVTYQMVQAVNVLSIPAVFRNMGGILLLSAIMVCLIIACLIYATRMLITQQHLSKLRDNFVFALTHDMKTPLGTIHAVLDQSAKGILDNHPEMKAKFTQIAIEQTLNMQALVNQILTVAYIEQNKLSLHKQPVDLPVLIQSLEDKFSVEKEKKIKFSTRYELNDGTLYADPFYLSNAISNLIDNSIKYSVDRVDIDIYASGKGNQVYIHVKDNASGISEQDQKKIFNRFERGGAIKRKSASGFGIGLSYVKSVVEAHDGGITLSSKEGLGSEFVITLPFNQDK